MPRYINIAMETEKDKPKNRPLELYLVHLDAFSLYYVRDYHESVEFYNEDGHAQTYEPIGITRSEISRTQELQTDEVEVNFDNVNLQMSELLGGHEFRGRELVIWKVFLDADRDVISATLTLSEKEQHIEGYRGHGLAEYQNHIELFRGRMDEPAVDDNELSVRVIGEIDILDRRIPRRKFGPLCQWQFGEEGCDIEISEENNTKIEGNVNSTSEDGFRIHLSEIDGDDDGYWSYGYIEVLGEERFVANSGSGYIDLDMPFFFDVAGQDYELVAGCDKTLSLPDDGNGAELNHGCAFWENEHRYGGFLSVPEGG